MIAEPMSLEMRAAAEKLAEEARESEPQIIKTFLFASAKEVRLVHVDTNARPGWQGEAIAPFYFGPDSGDGIPYPSALALIRPEEEGVFAPPAGWGRWEDAEVIWERSKNGA